MPTLERRVQILFDPEEYERLEAFARQERQSVGAVIRESVQRRLSVPTSQRQAALDRLFSRADSSPASPVDTWEDVKEGFERESLAGIS